jgi:hypothetical protein
MKRGSGVAAAHGALLTLMTKHPAQWLAVRECMARPVKAEERG